jgi:hypothetical protein
MVHRETNGWYIVDGEGRRSALFIPPEDHIPKMGQWGQICPFGSAAKSPVFGIESTVAGNDQIGNDTFSPIGRFDSRGG